LLATAGAAIIRVAAKIWSKSALTGLESAGYTRIDGFPPLELDLNFESFDDYVQTRLSKVMRKVCAGNCVKRIERRRRLSCKSTRMPSRSSTKFTHSTWT
jgi:hypothetical protein